MMLFKRMKQFNKLPAAIKNGKVKVKFDMILRDPCDQEEEKRKEVMKRLMK